MMGQHQEIVAGGALRSIIVVLAVAAVMVAMMVAMAPPAFAAPGEPQFANGRPNANFHAQNSGTANAFQRTPHNQPCSVFC